jgi:hypothetical protein
LGRRFNAKKNPQAWLSLAALPDLIEPIGIVEDAGFVAFGHFYILRFREKPRPTPSKVLPPVSIGPDVSKICQRQEELPPIPSEIAHNLPVVALQHFS